MARVVVSYSAVAKAATNIRTFELAFIRRDSSFRRPARPTSHGVYEQDMVGSQAATYRNARAV